MTSRPGVSNIAPLPAKRSVELLTWATVLFVLLTGLVPFDFAGAPHQHGSEEPFGVLVPTFIFPDAAGNLFLYLPIGVLLHWYLWRRLASPTAACLLAIGAAALLSGTVEFLQVYSSSRFSSIIDFTCNVLGACVGALMFQRCRAIIPRLTHAATREFRERQSETALKAYACAIAIVAVMPFSFSLDSTMFKKSLKTVTLVPFGAVAGGHWEAEIATEGGNRGIDAYAKWRQLKCWSRWSVELAAFAVLAWLARSVLADDYGFSRSATIALVWWLCGLYAVALSLLQLMLVTRAFDVTDVLFRFLGVACGTVLGSAYAERVGRASPDARARLHCRLVFTACAAALAYIFYTGVIPFTFEAQGGGPARALASKDFLPFFAYHTTRFDLMMADIMEKFVSYVVLAALLATVWKRIQGWTTARRAYAVATVGVGVSVVVEIVQMYIPVRVPSLTDLIIAATGSVVGVLAREGVVGFYRAVTGEGRLRTGPPDAEHARTARWSLSDALVASLIDPYSQAPTERMPTRTRRPP